MLCVVVVGFFCNVYARNLACLVVLVGLSWCLLVVGVAWTVQFLDFV